jgi:hypothetical protein
MLDVSTAHIQKHTADALTVSLDDGQGLVYDTLSHVAWHEYGWIIHACVDAHQREDLQTAGHGELADLLKFAADNGFNYLKLDCDAPRLPASVGLPTFEW